MNTSKTGARIVGALFLIAMVASLLGAALIESVLTAPDFLTRVVANQSQVITGVLLELINGIAVVGIAVMMFPMFEKHNKAFALGYVAIRTIEGMLQIVGDVIPLSLLTYSQQYLPAGAAEAGSYQASAALFLAARGHLVGTMLGIFFSLGALLFYTLLYQSKLTARFISVWGLIGAVLVLTWNLLETFGISMSAGMILALPIILNEIFLGIWLIIKGFNPPGIASSSA
jgi:Domain of unknown function (DUF4386)